MGSTGQRSAGRAINVTSPARAPSSGMTWHTSARSKGARSSGRLPSAIWRQPGSGRQTLEAPFVAEAVIHQPIVHPVRPSLPELHGLRADPPTSPVRRHRDVPGISELPHQAPPGWSPPPTGRPPTRRAGSHAAGSTSRRPSRPERPSPLVPSREPAAASPATGMSPRDQGLSSDSRRAGTGAH